MKIKEQAEKYFPQLRTVKALHGGDISATYLLENRRGEKRVLKLHASHPSATELFIREAEGLSALSKPGTLPVPQVFSFDKNHLLLSYLPPASSHSGFWKKLGVQLAQTHQKATSSFFGFRNSNFIGKNPQKNKPLEDDGKRAWADFFMENRLDVQMNWLSKDSNSPPLQSLQETYQKKAQSLMGHFTPISKKECLSPFPTPWGSVGRQCAFLFQRPVGLCH